MQNIEFETIIRENIIRLPEHLKCMDQKHVRVIIMDEKKNDLKKNLPEGFYKPMHASSYRVIGKREDIYEH